MQRILNSYLVPIPNLLVPLLHVNCYLQVVAQGHSPRLKKLHQPLNIGPGVRKQMGNFTVTTFLLLFLRNKSFISITHQNSTSRQELTVHLLTNNSSLSTIIPSLDEEVESSFCRKATC